MRGGPGGLLSLSTILYPMSSLNDVRALEVDVRVTDLDLGEAEEPGALLLTEVLISPSH